MFAASKSPRPHPRSWLLAQALMWSAGSLVQSALCALDLEVYHLDQAEEAPHPAGRPCGLVLACVVISKTSTSLTRSRQWFLSEEGEDESCEQSQKPAEDFMISFQSFPFLHADTRGSPLWPERQAHRWISQKPRRPVRCWDWPWPARTSWK